MPFGFSRPAAPAPAPRPVPPLTKIAVPSAGDVCQRYQPSPEAQALGSLNKTPTQYVQSMQDNHLSADSINFMAHGMPPREGVHWACKSTETVAPKLGVADQNALAAAQAWTKSPTAAHQAAAAQAAAKTDFQSPAAWAAQGAAVASKPGVPAAVANPSAPAVAGSVMLAAAWAQPDFKPPAPRLPQMSAPTLPAQPGLPRFEQPAVPKIDAPPSPYPPGVDRAQIAQIQQPYVDLGMDIASGQSVPS
jgi:hypothetical protein